VRFHDILSDIMNVVQAKDGKYIWNFYNVDQVYDYILSIGMKPLVELSFTPRSLASTPIKTVFWYKAVTSLPRSLTEWNMVIQTFVKHLIARYGINEVSQWPFEVWNEPNCGFLSATQQQFFELFKTVVDAIHAVHPSLKVGGPVTCQVAWIEETMAFITNGTIQADYISTHLYPTDFGDRPPPTVMRDQIGQVAKIVNGRFPVYITEFNDGLWSDPAYHDQTYAATFVVKSTVDVAGLADVFAWWTFTDVFDEGGQESGVFNVSDHWGLLGLYSIPKPSFRAFQLLHWTGDRRLPLSLSPGTPATVGAVATRNRTHVMVIAWNYDLPQQPPPSATICFSLGGFPSNYQNAATAYMIDDKHSNPYAAWIAMGAPAYPTSAQIASLSAAGDMPGRRVQYKILNGVLSFNVQLKPHAVFAVVLPL